LISPVIKPNLYPINHADLTVEFCLPVAAKFVLAENPVLCFQLAKLSIYFPKTHSRQRTGHSGTDLVFPTRQGTGMFDSKMQFRAYSAAIAIPDNTEFCEEESVPVLTGNCATAWP
jgi:hypothetical protein